jgi:hypothetical protein
MRISCKRDVLDRMGWLRVPLAEDLFDQAPLAQPAVARHHRADSNALESPQSDRRGGSK